MTSFRYAAQCKVKSAGFTLIEISIVLVIIGLILGGILQGQSLIRGMQAKDVITTAKDLSAAARFFKDRYNYLPGDFPISGGSPELTGLPAGCAAGGNGDGLIVATESTCVPGQLFMAGLIKGGTGPLKGTFGPIKVISRAASNEPAIAVSVLNVVEFANLPCDIAVEVDLKLDDGVINSGFSQASVANCASGGVNDPVPFFATPL